MTQQEFYSRTLVSVDSKEFDAINEVYMKSELDKDKFCELWCKMNPMRVAKAKEDIKKQEELQELKWDLANLYWSRQSLDFEASMRLADNEFSDEEKVMLSKVGISLEEEPQYSNCYVRRFKNTYQVIAEVESYLNKVNENK